MAFGDLLDTLALTAVMPDSFMVKLQRLAADVLTFEPGSPRAGAHPLDDQATFEFRDGSDDGPAQRTTFRRFSSSSTSKKCLTDRAIRSDAQTRTTSKRPRRPSAII